MKNKKIGRRKVVKGIGALGALAGVSASPFASMAAEVIGGSEIAKVDSSEKGSELNFLCWEGYDYPENSDPFAKQYGSKMRFQLVNSDPDAVNKLRGGQDKVFDLVKL